MRTSWLRLLGVGAALALVGPFIALSSSGAAGAASGGANPITIGVICSCTGPLGPTVAIEPPAVYAFASYENAHGGIDGHHVDVVEKNDDSNPGNAVTDVMDLVTQNHITVLFDDSEEDTGFGSYVESQKIPVIGGGSDSDLFLTNPDWFSPGATVDSYFVAYMKAAKEVGAKTVGQLYCAESSVCSEGVPSFRANAAAEGLKVGIEDEISASAPNYDAQCVAAKDAGVGMLNIADATFVVEKVAQECATQGYTGYYVGGGAAVAPTFATVPAFKNKFIGFVEDIPFFATSVPGVKTYIDAMKKYQPSTLTNPNYSEVTIQNWISGLLLAAAVKGAGATASTDVTPATVLKGLYSLHGETLGGMAPPLTYKKGSPTLIHCWFWLKAANGKFTTPYGTTPACGTPVS